MSVVIFLLYTLFRRESALWGGGYFFNTAEVLNSADRDLGRARGPSIRPIGEVLARGLEFRRNCLAVRVNRPGEIGNRPTSPRPRYSIVRRTYLSESGSNGPKTLRISGKWVFRARDRRTGMHRASSITTDVSYYVCGVVPGLAHKGIPRPGPRSRAINAGHPLRPSTPTSTIDTHCRSRTDLITCNGRRRVYLSL